MSFLNILDSPVNLQLLSRLFEKRGFECDKAADGLEALAAVRKDVNHPYDIIFMDANMPNMVSEIQLRSSSPLDTC